MLHYEFHITALCIYDCSGVFHRPRHRTTIHKFIFTPMPISMFSAPLISDKVNASQQQGGRVGRTTGDGRCQELLAAAPLH